MIHLYYGEGKGKTTAALGLTLRAAGNGLRVVFVQFLKGAETGEVAALVALPQVTVLRGKNSGVFSHQMDEAQRAAAYAAHMANLAEARRLLLAGECDLLVLDEVLRALQAGLLAEEAVRALLSELPPEVELVLTGRQPPDFLLAAADYITEMKCLRHPYEQGIAARKGIEY